MSVYPLRALRALALHAQGLGAPAGTGTQPGREVLYRTVERLGCVQIDTLQMVRRSQYLVLWSRLGSYDPDDFEALASAADRRLFEGWQHAASLIPLGEYRYQLPRQRRLREAPGKNTHAWISDPENAVLVRSVLERIRREGALRTSDFEGDGRKRASWWDWKPAKQALEHLYAWGDLMIAGRHNFQRLYDLSERVLPDWVDRREPTAAERDRFWVEGGARALGVCTPRQAGDYTWMNVTRSRPAVADLLEEGVLVQIAGKLEGGKTADLLVHHDNLPLLGQAADGELQAGRTTFLSPFDSLFWAGGRDGQLWGFDKSLEAYLPAAKRTYGYYCLPILHRDRLVGRFDPKLERRTGTLILRALYLEPGVKPDPELVGAVAGAMRDFMHFHAARQLVIERSEPAAFARKLLAAI
jgi:hypothetical protein